MTGFDHVLRFHPPHPIVQAAEGLSRVLTQESFRRRGTWRGRLASRPIGPPTTPPRFEATTTTAPAGREG